MPSTQSSEPATDRRQRSAGRRLVLVTVAVLVLVIVGWAGFVSIVQPGSPSAFYDPPDRLPAGSPGQIIRDEPVEADAGRQVWRVLYTSTDPSGHPIAVSGIVIAPAGAPPAGGWPVVAWAHGTSGVASRCAPSMTPGAGLARIPELDALLAGGAVVAVTDYPGLGTPGPHPYLVGDSEGRAVLDSVRATHALLGDRVSSTTAVYGHSQGGHAALFADALASSYAPDLDVVGVAAMAPPTALAELLDADRTELDGIVLTALAVASWSRYYPDTDPTTIVDEAARPLVEDLATRCITTTAESLTDLPDVAALAVGFLSADPATAPGWSTRLRENSSPSVDSTIPLLIAQGLTDEIVRPEVTGAFVTKQCADGATLELDEYPDTGHFAVRSSSAPSVTAWLLARLDGTPAPAGCRTITR